MYCSRPVARSPSVVRVVRPASKCGARHASFFPSQPFFPRFPGSAMATSNDFAPFFRLFDDLTPPAGALFRNGAGSFQPRFDVREVGETYELRGELPGVESKDLEVEFADEQTLIIRGRTEKETTSGTPPVLESAEAPKAVADADNSDAASTYSTGSYQKATVEDDGAEAAEATQATPAESTTEAVTEPAEKPTEQPKEPSSRYWISERSTGSFQRVFNFQSKVDQDAVKASLKNGILSIVVPKAAAPEAKKITVE